MSFNSKQNQSSSESQMKDAFANNPVRDNPAANLVAGLDLNQKKATERKQSVSITILPSMKQDLVKLAKKNGYNGLSSFAVDVFQALLDQEK